MPDRHLDLEEIMRRLDGMDRKLSEIISLMPPPNAARLAVPYTLASLPEHLRKTAFAIARIGEATAEKVATETGRSRAAESDYLNQLASKGFLKKERKDREMHFKVFALYTTCPLCRSSVQMNLECCPVCGARLLGKQPT